MMLSVEGDIRERSAEILGRVRGRRPRVHCITNAVAQTFTANVLLAIGAVPSMTIAPDEIGDFVAQSDALLVNLGTLDAARRDAIEAAVEAAGSRRLPWLLDPVFVDRSKRRAAYAQALIRRKPSAIRLNAQEFTTLAECGTEREGVARYAAACSATVGLTGEVDLIADARRCYRVANGHPLMARITAMGCAGSAVAAACLAVEEDAFVAVAAALLLFGVAGELAAERAHGPGSYAVEMLDAVYALDREAIVERARVTE